MAGVADPACTGNVMVCAGQAALDAATSSVANTAADSAFAGLGQAINAALVSVTASLGTLWAQLPTPDLATFGGAGGVTAGDAPPASGQLDTVVGWIAWGALVAAILAMIILGALTAASRRQGEGGAFANRYVTWALGVVIISGATSLVSFLLPAVPTAGSGTVSFITNATWWLAGSVAVITTIIAGAKVAVQQRAQAGLQQLQSLIVLIVVSLAGVALVGALSQLADDFSSWVLRTSMTCDPAGSRDCFTSNMALVLPNLLDPGQSGLGVLLFILLGLVAVLVTLGQVALMVVRIAMLILLAGLLPLSAAGASTEVGRMWFRRNLVWLGAFLLYKPAAAMIYAVAFQLAGTDFAAFDTTGLVAVLAGLALMVVAIVALPVMLRFAVPAASAVAGGSGGGGAGLAAAVALPTGAVSLGRAAMGASGGGSGGAGPAGPSGADGATSSSPTGGSGSGGTGAPAPRTSSEGNSGAGGSNPFAAPGAGGSGAATGGAGATGGTGAAAGGGAGAAGAGAAGARAAGGASAGASAGAAGGPVGMAAGAALGQAASAATGAVRGVADGARDAAQSSSEPTGPTGSAGAPAPPAASRWNTTAPGSSGPSSAEPDEGDMPDGSR